MKHLCFSLLFFLNITIHAQNNGVKLNQKNNNELTAQQHFEANDYPLALKFYKLAIADYSSPNNGPKLIEFNIKIGDIYYAINDYENVLKNYLIALEIAENEQLISELNQIKLNIGNLYLRLAQYDLAFKYLFESKTYYLQNQKTESKNLSFNYQLIGIAYGNNNSLDSAIYNFNQALVHTNEKNNSTFYGGILNNIGAIYSKRDENEKALKHYQKAITTFDYTKEKIGKGVSMSNIAYIYGKQEKYEEAITLYLNSFELFKESNGLIYLRDNYANISEVYEKSGNYKDALKYSNLYLNLSDSITNSEMISDMANLQMQFEIGKKNQELILLEQENKLIETENTLIKVKQFILIAGIIFLILIGLLIFRNLRTSLKNSKLTKTILQKEKQELTSEIKYKKKELEDFAFRIIEKNNLLASLKHDVKNIETKNMDKIRDISLSINSNLNITKDRKEFEMRIDKTQNSFFLKLENKFPALTKNEQRLCSLLLLNLSSKDIASILNISPDGVKKSRYRLRKKLQLDSKQEMSTYLKSL